MAGFYSKQLGPTLAQKLESLTNAPQHEQLKLSEEIAVARVMTAQAIKMCEPVLDNRPGVTDELRAMAQSLLKDCLGMVSGLVESASRVERNAEDKISVNVLQLFVTQVTTVIYEVLGTEHIDLARIIEERLRTTVKLPVHERRDFDQSVRVNILEQVSDRLIKQMESATIPSDTAPSDDEQEPLQDSDCGEAIGEDGAGEETFGDGSGGEETLA